MKTLFRFLTPMLLLLFFAAPQMASTARASAPTAASGSFQFVSSVVTGGRLAGRNGIFTLEQTVDITGALAGAMVCNQRQMVLVTGAATFQDVCTFTGSIDARPGTAAVDIEGTIAADGTSYGHFVIFAGTGSLAGLHGDGTIDGDNSGGGTYSGRLHFAP